MSDETAGKNNNITITREEAIKVLMQATDREDPYWENLVQDLYDEETDTLPSVWDVFRAAGFSDAEIERASGLPPGRLAELEPKERDE